MGHLAVGRYLSGVNWSLTQLAQHLNGVGGNLNIPGPMHTRRETTFGKTCGERLTQIADCDVVLVRALNSEFRKHLHTSYSNGDLLVT